MSLEEKQQYLSEEIIQQNYDGNEFSEFIKSFRGEEEVDLDSWTLEDLKTVVAEFKSQYQPKQAEQENQEEQNVQNENEKPQEEQNQENVQENVQEIEQEKKETVIPKPATENTFPNEFLDPLYLVLKTEKLEINEISDNNNLFITISNPIRIKPSLLQMPYYQYDVKTDPVGFKVVRKLSDFTFLYETLPLINCAVFNPILPHFEFGLKDDSPKKMLYLQNYMNSLVENKFFRTLPIVYEFLTLPQNNWNKKRSDYQKLKTLPLSKMPTLEGSLEVNINKEEDSKALKIKETINKKTEALDLLNNTMDEILAIFDKLNTLYKNLAKSFLELEKAHQNNDIMSSFFNRLKQLSELWSKDYVKEKEFLKDEFKYFFKFINKENTSYLRKFEEFRVTREEYRTKYEKVKKMQIKQNKDIELVKKLRVEYGMQLLMVNREYDNLIERQANRCMIQFMKYHENQTIILQDYENCRRLFEINQQENNGGENGQENEGNN